MPSTITGFGISANFETVMFYFDAVNDIDLDSYAYQLYDNSAGTGSPVATGRNKANVFTISVTNSTDSTPKTYYGRVAVVNSAGIVGTYTNLVSSGATPLIGNQYISELTASKITSGTIGAHTITLSGANSIIQSSSYAADPLTGWHISGDGELSFGGPNGINYNPISGVSIGSAVTITANSGASSVSFAGLVISSGADGIAVGSASENYWLTSGKFRTGNNTKYMLFDPSDGSFTINGTKVEGGTIGGISAGSSSIYLGANTYANANTPFYVDTSSKFSLGDKLYFNGTNLTVGGTINATGGSFTGTVTSGGVHLGVMVPGGGYYKGINLSPDSNTQFQSCFIRGDGGEVYFRADNGSQWIRFENGTVQINTPGFTLNGSSAVFAGSLSGASGSVGASFSIGNSLTIGNNVRINGATGDGGKSIVKIRADAEGDNSLNHPLLVVNYSNENLFRVRRDGRIDMGKTTTGSTDEAAEVYVNGTLVHGSDIRFKKDISSTVLGLNFINQLEPVQYYLKDQTTPYKHEGFIAQDVKKVLNAIGIESSIWKESDDEELYQYLNYQEFIAPLVKAVQELSAKVDELESRLI